MKPLYILALVLILAACTLPESPVQQTQTAAVTPVKTMIGIPPHAEATLTAVADGSNDVPDYQVCAWVFDAYQRYPESSSDYAVVPVYEFPYSGAPFTNYVIVASDEVYLTGRIARNTSGVVSYDDEFVEIYRVNDTPLDYPVWARFIQVFVDGRSSEQLPAPRILFSRGSNCPPEPPTPTPEVTTQPQVETWEVKASALNIRPTCSTGNPRIGVLPQGAQVQAYPEVISAEGLEWRRLADREGCIAVRGQSVVFAVKV